MTLQKRIKKDLSAAIKAKDEQKKNTLRVILGELDRLDKKEFSNGETIKVLKKLIKSEREVLEKQEKTTDSEFVRTIEAYLPEMATEAEIKSWIEQNIDFSMLKNKMQAMGQIMKHFGATADGNAVKKILQQL